jgi:hypothetical protein
LPSDRVALAYVRRDQTLHLATLAISEQAVELLADVTIEGVHTQHAPALAAIRVAPEIYGAERALGVLYRSATTGALEQALALDPQGPFTRRPALDRSGAEIRTAEGPSVAALPTGELCGVFPDAQSQIRFYCYEVGQDRWIDLSARAFDVELGPRTGSNVGIAYHRYRDASGGPISGDSTAGALYLSFSEPESSAALFPDNPHFYVSQWLSARHGAFEQISFRWRGRIITEWTNLAPGSGVALLEDDQSPNLQALMVLRTGSGALRLDYLPYADGEFDEPLQSGNDFQVMERGICLGLRTEEECGGPDTAAY